MDLELYDSLTFQELDVEFWGDNDALKPIKPAVEDVVACLPEYDTDLRTEINRLKKALPQPNSLVELLMEESHTPDPADMPSIFNQKKSDTCNLQKVPSLTDISKPSRNIMASSAATELPLFTPGTNRKMSMALKTSFGLFESERKRGNIPLNPLAWSQTHVSQWLAWICREFNITNLNTIYFKKTGRELLEMGEETFLAIAPPFTGDVLWEHLIYLIKENNNAENDVLEQALLENGLLGPDVMLGAPVTDNRSSQSYDLLSSMDMEDAVFNTNESLLSQIDPPPYGSNGILNYNPMAMPLTAEQLQYRPLLRKSMSGGCMTVENDANDQTVPSLKSDQWDSQSTSWGSPSSDTSANADLPTIPGCNHNGPIQLWQFLLQLLMDKNSQHIICWTGDGWEFKVLDTEELARRWGQRKNKPKMTYEKLSRGIRYYYDKKLIKKTSGKRYTYQYVCDLSGMLNHTPESLFRACGVSPRYDLDDAYN